MYKAPVDNMATKQVVVDTSDISQILAVYFPDNEFSVDEDKLMLTVDLIQFFSTPPGLDFALQVHQLSLITLRCNHC